MLHIERYIRSLPRATKSQPVEETQRALDRLRSVCSLLDQHHLEESFELEIFCDFLSKIPKNYTDKYVKTLKGALPSLRVYLSKMEPLVKQKRAESIYYPEASRSAPKMHFVINRREYTAGYAQSA